MMLTQNILEVENVSRFYSSIPALKDISFNWEKGILGLVGPNGAGKSTLIKIISTLIKPSSGQVRVFNKDVIKDPQAVRRQIGVLFENPVFNHQMRVFRSLRWVGQVRGLTKKQAELDVNERLEYFRLNSTHDLKIRELSAGMKQKYGLIFASLGSPRLIILDEPTSNLDPDTRELYELFVKRLHNEDNCSFLISSHILDELDRLCHGFVFIFNGYLAESGKRKHLSTRILKIRYRIETETPTKVLKALTEHKIAVEAVDENQIIINMEKTQKIKDISSTLQKILVGIDFSVSPLETEIHALYRSLRKQNESRSIKKP